MVRSSIAAVGLLLCAFTLCQAAEPQIGIAKVDMFALEPLLLEVAFSKPGNHAVRDKYVAFQERERAMLAGEVDLDEIARGFSLGQMDIEDTVANLARGELILLIEELFGDRYQLVVSDSYGDGILYTEIVIPDITPNIKQRLLKDRAASQTQPQDTPAN